LSAKSCCRLAGSGKEAITLVGACDFTGRDAHTDLACFAIGAEVGVVAGGIVGLHRVRAESSTRVAYAHFMAVVERGADDGIPWLACSVFTDVVDRAAIGIITGGAIILRWVVADSSFRNANTYVVALAECLADHRFRAYTSSIHASVIGRVAGGAIGFITEVAVASFRIAEGSDLALIGLWALEACDCRTDTQCTFLSEGAKASVIAGCSIFFYWVGANSGIRVADTGNMAIV
jgi:hypothetical protein